MGTLMDSFQDHVFRDILLMIWLLYLWKLYLNLRQRSLIQRLVDLPQNVEGLMTNDIYQKARAYALDRINFVTFEDFCQNVFSTIHLLGYFLYYYWQYSIKIAQFFGYSADNEIVVSMICMLVMAFVGGLLSLPLTVYETFVVEQKHGFNKQTPLFFVKDQVLKFVVSQCISMPILCGIIWIIKVSGDYSFVYMWVFSVFIILFMMILYPEVIAPLFDKYSPLPEGELKQKIEELAASLNFPLYKLFIVQGSKRSSHSNAYLYGFHKHKRIVLFDTLCKEYYVPDAQDTNKEKGCDTNEILAVIGHELGHWMYHHVWKLFLLTQIGLFLTFLSFTKLIHYTPMYVAFGFTDSQPIFIGLNIISMYISIPINTVGHVVLVYLGRLFEFQADAFAKKLGHAKGLKSALIKLHKDNLQFPVHDKLYTAWYHNHPPTLERLEAIGKDD